VVFVVELRDTEQEIAAAVFPHDPIMFRKHLLLGCCKIEMPEYMRRRALWECHAFAPSGKPDRTKIRELYVKI
jgi:hypothetical protein